MPVFLDELDHLHETLIERIRAFMDTKQYSVNRLADLAGIARGNLSKILAGKISPTVRTVGKIADCLGVEVADLFRGA